MEESLGTRLQKLRKACDYTQEEMGRKLNISGSAYGNYERDQRKPDLDMLERIARIFDISVFELYHPSVQTLRESSVYTCGTGSQESALSRDESQMLSDYRHLSTEGKREARAFISFRKQYEQKAPENT